MPHERLNALLASFIPLIPLLFQRGAQDVDWGIVTDSKPFAPKYLPPVPGLLKDEALINLYYHAYDIDSIPGPRWFLDAISQSLGTSHPVADALRALRSHFQVNVVPSSLLLWVIGLLFLALVSFLDPADIHTSSPGTITTSYKTPAQVSSSNMYPTCNTSGSAESVKSDLVVDWRGEMDDTIPLPPFGIKLSTHFPLSPIEEEEEVQDHSAASPLSPDAADVSGAESVVRRSSSSHLSSSLSSQSASHTSNRNLSLDVSVPSTPSRSTEGDIEEQSYPSLGNNVDASSTSTDFVFTIVPPSTSDLDSVMDLDSPPSPRGEAAEVFLSSTTPDVPSTASSTQNTPSSGLLPVSSVYPLSDVTPVEDQLEEVYGRGTSLEAADRVKINNVLVSEPTAIPALDEDPQPTVQELDEEPQPMVQELVELPSPARPRALSNITEITEPNDSSDSSPGTPRVEWFSGIHGGLASLDHHGLTLQATRGVAEGGTTASTPEVDVESHWSLFDFLPLSTSTPNLHSTVVCQPEDANSPHGDTGTFQAQEPRLGLLDGLDRSLHGVVDAATPGFPVPPLVDLVSSVDSHVPSSLSSSAHTDLRNEDDQDGKRFEDTVTTLPLDASVADVSSEPQQSQSQVPVAHAEEAAPKKPVSTVLFPTVAQMSLDASPPVHPCPPSTSPEVLFALAPPTMSPIVPDRDDKLQSQPPDQPMPKVTRARRASRVSGTSLKFVNRFARIGIAGQQVALTDAGLAQLVARLDKPLPPEEDARGERRRMERVTSTAMGEHSAKRGEPRNWNQVIHERRYSKEPISARNERDIIDAAYHPPLKNDPHIRIPVCELGRSRSSVHVRSTTNVALVKRPSVSASPQDLSAVDASPLLLPRNWGHRRAQSEIVNSSGTLIAGDQNRRLSYAAIAAEEPPSQPLRLPVDSNEVHKPATVHHVSSTKVATVEPVEATAKLRTVSAPASSTSPMFRFGHVDDQASWRNGNRWSALAAPTSSIGKEKGRLQELSSATMPCTILGDKHSIAEKRWPQSRLLKALTLAPSTSAGKVSEATCSPLLSSNKDYGLGSSDSGASRVRGSILSAASRVKLRDLALSAQQSVVAPPPVVVPSFCPGSGSNAASGSDATLYSGAIPGSSGSSSASSESVIFACSGTTCVPVSFAQPGPAVNDKAPLVGQLQANFAEASGDLLAQSRGTQPCSADASRLESLLLLPTRSIPDVHSSPLDESADLVIASRECRPLSPTGDCPAVVRLNASSSPSARSSSSCFRSSTAPTFLSSPSPSAVDESSSRAPVAVPSRHDFAPRGIIVPRMPTPDQSPGLDLPRLPTRRRERREMSSTFLLQREQRSTRAAGFSQRGTLRS
ncbi:hypothetical protein V8D89_008456 [Ganoderma adspersum]